VSSRAAGWARALAAAGVVVALDQLTKWIAVSSIERGRGIDVLFGFELTNTRNRGIAFGALEGSETLVGILIGIAIAAVLVFFALRAARPWLWLPVGMLLGGAAGNLIDRAREGAVIDFLDPPAWPAFNLADSSIVLGVLALLYVLEGPRER
jgi:signal peptidase II